ncbi:unnamed protein product [Caretta caretta]
MDLSWFGPVEVSELPFTAVRFHKQPKEPFGEKVPPLPPHGPPFWGLTGIWNIPLCSNQAGCSTQEGRDAVVNEAVRSVGTGFWTDGTSGVVFMLLKPYQHKTLHCT